MGKFKGPRGPLLDLEEQTAMAAEKLHQIQLKHAQVESALSSIDDKRADLADVILQTQEAAATLSTYRAHLESVRLALEEKKRANIQLEKESAEIRENNRIAINKHAGVLDQVTASRDTLESNQTTLRAQEAKVSQTVAEQARVQAETATLYAERTRELVRFCHLQAGTEAKLALATAALREIEAKFKRTSDGLTALFLEGQTTTIGIAEGKRVLESLYGRVQSVQASIEQKRVEAEKEWATREAEVKQREEKTQKDQVDLLWREENLKQKQAQGAEILQQVEKIHGRKFPNLKFE